MENLEATRQLSASDKTIVTPAVGGQATLLGVPVKCPICQTDNSPTEKYCGECGFLLSSTPAETAPPEAENQPRLVSTSGWGDFFLKQGENSVGRESADVLLGEQTVSRRHALIILDADKCFVEDLSSTNGTFVAGVQVREGQKVEAVDGAELKFGSVALTLSLPSPAAEPSAPEVAAEEPALETAELEGAPSSTAVEPVTGMSGSSEEEAPESTEEAVQSEEKAAEPAEEVAAGSDEPSAAFEPLPTHTDPVARLISVDFPPTVFGIKEGINTVGRRAGNDIIVSDDPYVSGSHAQIVVDELGMWLIDSGSTNGTVLNGAAIKPNTRMALSGDDEVTFGQTAFKFLAP
jgi:pSer/pThr/pTyr-binding forkhead associated (FHA) protein